MSDEPRKYSQAELVKVLEKAAEREGREGPRSFSPDEIVQAGRELGLAPGTVQAELEALARRQSNRALAERPFDTRISLEASADTLVLEIPPRGLHGAALAKLGGSGFMLAFIGFWTWGAAQASAVFAAFSLPFWLAGLGMLGGAVKGVIGSQRLELGRERGTLVSRPFGTRRELHTSQLRVRLDRIKHRANRNQSETESPVLALDHGTKTIHLLKDFSEAEQRWVRSELDHWLAG